jgi:hypothetical protein
MTTFAKLLNHTASVKRYVRSSGRGSGSSTVVIPSLSITQPVSIDYNTAQRVGTTHRTILNEPFKFRMVLFEGDNDVQQGDVMTIDAGSTEYPVRHVEQWPFVVAGQTRMVAILEYDVR